MSSMHSNAVTIYECKGVDGKTRYKCSNCAKVFETRGGCRKHVKETHEGNIPQAPCGQKVRGGIRRHVKTCAHSECKALNGNATVEEESGPVYLIDPWARGNSSRGGEGSTTFSNAPGGSSGGSAYPWPPMANNAFQTYSTQQHFGPPF